MKPPLSDKERVRAFSLVELLAAIAVLAVLSAIVLTAVGGVRRNAAETQSVSRLRNLGSAMILYTQDHGGELPAPWDSVTGDFWRQQLYDEGYLGESSAWREVPGQSEPSYMNHPMLSCPIQDMMHPDAQRTDSFAMNRFLGKVSSPTQAHGAERLSLVKEPGRTALVGNGQFKEPRKTYNLEMHPSIMPEADARGITGILYADGHVERIPIVDVPTTVSAADPSGITFWKGE